MWQQRAKTKDVMTTLFFDMAVAKIAVGDLTPQSLQL